MITRSLAIALLLATPSFALAQPPRAVSLDVHGCEGAVFDVLGTLEATRVELAADGIRDVHAATSDDGDPLARIQITEACTEQPTFVVRIDDLVTHKSVERTLTLEGIAPSAVSRALAIATAELLRASWAELELADAPTEEPGVVEALRVRVRGLREARGLGAPTTPPEAAVESPPAPPPPAARVEVVAQGVVRAFPAGGASPLGGRVAVEVPVGDAVRLIVDGEVVFGTSIHPLGQIDLGLASGGLSLRYDVSLDVARLALGVRAAGGVAWTQGHATSSSVVGAGGQGFVLLIGGVLGCVFPLGDLVSLRVDVEGGGAAVGFEAYVDRAPVAGLIGGYFGASIGLALRL